MARPVAHVAPYNRPAMGAPLEFGLIDEAARFLESRVRKTPLEPSPGLSERIGVPTWLKLENLQLTGSFKLRGALFALSRLGPAAREHGVGTCSAGNHGLGLAYAARELGVAATIFVPSSVDAAKRAGILELGAEVVDTPFPGYDDSEAWARERLAESDALWVSAFDDPAIMAGNGGSLAMELLDELTGLQAVVVPTGGGGLAAGLAVALEERVPHASLICCQHARSPGLARSLEEGRAVTRLPAIETVAGGVEGGIGARCFEVLRDRVDQIALIEEGEIRDAVRWLVDRHGYLVEPSAAVAAAACLRGDLRVESGPVVVVLTGRNVARETLAAILSGD